MHEVLYPNWELSPPSARSPEDAWYNLTQHGFCVVSDTEPEFDFDPGFREYVLENYFNGGKLQPEKYDVFPPDRERARDVIRYTWTDDGLLLEENPTVNITQRTYFAGEREYDRTLLLQDERFRRWIEDSLYLIPHIEHDPDLASSTMGINLFRTFSSVVSGPHRDGEEFVIIYVVDKHGTGAETSLHKPLIDKPYFSATLQPGQRLIFNDRRFRHSVTPLIPATDGTARRDAIVCTVNRPELGYLRAHV